MFHDMTDVVMTFGRQIGPDQLALALGTYVAHATADDEIVHLAELTLSVDDLVLFLPCRRLIIDGKADALAHLRRPEVLIDCMTCLVRGLGR